MEITAYRGEYGPKEQRLQTYGGSLTFDADPEIAELYATYPNDHKNSVEFPKILKAKLTMNNPIVNTPEDPFIDFSVLISALGFEKTAELVLKYAEDEVYDTSIWREDYYERYDSLADLLQKEPENLKNLYCMGFPLFDTPEVVDVMKAAGYDGAIYGGYGENMGSIEYRAFDRRQIDVLDVEFLNRKDEKDMEKEMEKKLPWDVKSKGPHIDSIEMMVSTAAEKETFSNRALFEAENYLRDVGLHGLPQETITVHTTAHYSDGKMVSFDVRTNPLLATKEQPLAECLWNALDKNPAYMQNPPEPQKFLVNAAVDNLYAKLLALH